jgi:hypothetical protein
MSLGYILIGEKFKINLDIHLCPFCPHQSVHLSVSDLAEESAGIKHPFSVSHLLWTPNSHLTPSRPRYLAPLTSFQTPCAVYCQIRLVNKVRILSKYLHILMEKSPATFQTCYL